MNAKSTPPTPRVKDWLVSAKKSLTEKNIRTASLDSELILMHAINETRAYIIAHDDQILSKSQVKTADKMLQKRANYYPIAYILGKKEFYGRDYIVNKNTLIPRPESEDIIDVLKQILLPTTSHLPPTKLIDVGTGSGCLGITAKLEFPNIQVELIDISKKSLDVAAKNAANLKADVKISRNNLLNSRKTKANIIIANLPYVDRNWRRSPETNFEPKRALFAENNGLELIQKLIKQASKAQNYQDILLIESDPCQHKNIIEFAENQSYKYEKIQNYIILFSKL